MNSELFHRSRSLASVLIKDWARYRRALKGTGAEYLALCNRQERLEQGPDGRGFRCDWQWTSELHAPKYLPALGVDLIRRALHDHPIRRMAAPPAARRPDVSYVIGHRGSARIPQLLATLESIAGQCGAAVECVVVEQDDQPLLARHLPGWVRHVHTPLPETGLAYCRSWAFNVGARHIGGDILVLHDNDMLVPRDHAAHVLDLVRRGHEVLNLKRFVFYLTQEHTLGVLASRAELTDAAPLAVVQNLEGGGSVAITRAAYEAIGGFDEAFIGWGGEDVEFWERACTRRVWPYAFLPLVHLWHSAQAGKGSPEADTLRLYHSRAHVPVAQRIARLHELGAGSLSGPRTGDALF